MDWSKLDAALAAELAESPEASGRYAVFVHLAGQVQPPRLAELGLDVAGEGRVRTATVSWTDVDRLSEQADVHHIALSRRLGLPGRT